jgi:hypothetical protein
VSCYRYANLPDAGFRFVIVGGAGNDMNVTVQLGSRAETPIQFLGLKRPLYLRGLLRIWVRLLECRVCGYFVMYLSAAFVLELERRGGCPFCVIPELAWTDWRKSQKPIMVFGILAEIGTQIIPSGMTLILTANFGKTPFSFVSCSLTTCLTSTTSCLCAPFVSSFY